MKGWLVRSYLMCSLCGRSWRLWGPVHSCGTTSAPSCLWCRPAGPEWKRDRSVSDLGCHDVHVRTNVTFTTNYVRSPSLHKTVTSTLSLCSESVWVCTSKAAVLIYQWVLSLCEFVPVRLLCWFRWVRWLWTPSWSSWQWTRAGGASSSPSNECCRAFPQTTSPESWQNQTQRPNDQT